MKEKYTASLKNIYNRKNRTHAKHVCDFSNIISTLYIVNNNNNRLIIIILNIFQKKCFDNIWIKFADNLMKIVKVVLQTNTKYTLQIAAYNIKFSLAKNKICYWCQQLM